MSSPSRFTAAAAALLALLTPVAALAQGREAPITPAELRAHVDVLASPGMFGRRPAGPGEVPATNYIIRELSRRGVTPGAHGTSGGGWLQRVPLIERQRRSVSAEWRTAAGLIAVSTDALILFGRDARTAIADAPVIFAGHGAVIPNRGINQLAGADFHGAVALILYDGPAVEGFPNFAERRQALTAAGAVAVIGIVGPEVAWDEVRVGANEPLIQLDSPRPPPAFGAMSWAGAEALLRGAGRDLAAMLSDQPGSSFRSVALPVRASLDVRSQVRTLQSNNVIGRIRGSARDRESVVLLAHWDHLGICGGARDYSICPGAVDNASGVAAIIEAAGRIARGPRPGRDVLILATTAEEMGLLGAEWFATHLPAGTRVVAALNTDSTAIAPAGTPVAVMGGTPAMEQVIARVAVDGGRRLDFDRDADVLVQRQDGFALQQHGIAAAMVGGSFSDMARLGAFLQTRLHTPADAPTADIDYSGAAEDANLLVALTRAFADPAQYRSTPPPAAAAPPAGAGE